jgi:hypothetical protein
MAINEASKNSIEYEHLAKAFTAAISQGREDAEAFFTLI